MKLYHLSTGPLKVNSYFLVNEQTMGAIVIDCGECYNQIKKVEEEKGFKIKAVLLTHAHFDHAGCAKKLQEDGAVVYVSEKDADKLKNDDNLAAMFGRTFDKLSADKTFADGDELFIEGIKIKAILTAGHTDGSACFLVDDMLFSGDTLFFRSVGRTDFPTGNREELVKSVKKLFELKWDYSIYPGHEGFTRLSDERKYNLFVDYD